MVARLSGSEHLGCGLMFWRLAPPTLGYSLTEDLNKSAHGAHRPEVAMLIDDPNDLALKKWTIQAAIFSMSAGDR